MYNVIYIYKKNYKLTESQIIYTHRFSINTDQFTSTTNFRNKIKQHTDIKILDGQHN